MGMADDFPGPFRPASVPHLSPTEIAQYLDAATNPLDRPRIEAHLVRCEVCLEEVLAALRLLKPTARPPSD